MQQEMSGSERGIGPASQEICVISLLSISRASTMDVKEEDIVIQEMLEIGAERGRKRKRC